jgi:hypothetical protein
VKGVSRRQSARRLTSDSDGRTANEPTVSFLNAPVSLAFGTTGLRGLVKNITELEGSTSMSKLRSGIITHWWYS